MGNRPARDCRSTQASYHSHAPASGTSRVAARANRSPLLATLAPNQYASTGHGRTGTTSGVCKESLTLPPLRKSGAHTPGPLETRH